MFPANFPLWSAIVLAFVITVALGDIRWRKIPRVFVIAGFLAGLVFHMVSGGFLSALVASLIGFALGVTFFALGAIGGGDVKLITTLGAMLGLDRWLFAMEVAIFAAALIAIIQAVRHGMLRQTLANVVETFRWILDKGVKQHPVINVANKAMLRAPFGVAAALGTFFALVRM